jgi:hypothetical protein
MRDAKRVLASLPIALRISGPGICVPDVIGLEALRTLAPELHDSLDDCAVALTTTTGSASAWQPRGQDDTLKARVDSFIQADSCGGDVARGVIEALFPAAQRHINGRAVDDSQQWERHRRVAHPQGVGKVVG